MTDEAKRTVEMTSEPWRVQARRLLDRIGAAHDLDVMDATRAVELLTVATQDSEREAQSPSLKILAGPLAGETTIEGIVYANDVFRKMAFPGEAGGIFRIERDGETVVMHRLVPGSENLIDTIGEPIDRKYLITASNRASGEVHSHNDGVVFLAKDAALPPTLLYYRTECAARGATPEFLEAIDLMLQRVDTFQLKKGNKVPDMDPLTERHLIEPNKV